MIAHGEFVLRNRFDRRWCCCFLLGLAGCGGNAEDVYVPSYNPGRSASKAMALYDANKNGSLEDAELEACPSLKVAMPRIDTDGNGKLSEAEIAARIGVYKAQGVGLTAVSCVILRNGQPLQGATITFEPEELLKETLKPATGTTDSQGRTGLIKEGAPGIQVGLYRVLVTLPNEKLPPQYNEKTTLGAEVAGDVPGLERGLTFEIKP